MFAARSIFRRSAGVTPALKQTFKNSFVPLSHVERFGERYVPVLVACSQREYREHERTPLKLLPCIAAAAFAVNSVHVAHADDHEPETDGGVPPIGENETVWDTGTKGEKKGSGFQCPFLSLYR